MVQFYKASKQKNKRSSSKNSKAKTEAYNVNIQMDTFDHAANGVCLSTKPITVVENALPDETCEVRVTKETKQVRFASVHKVIQANPQRIKPLCEYYDICGGCHLQHTHADYGLSIKNQALQSYLENKSQVKPEQWLAPITSDYPDYRRRVRLAVDARGLKSAGGSETHGSAKIGYRSANSNKVVDIPYCAIAKPEINQVIASLHSQLKLHLGMTQFGHIVITQGAKFVQLALFLTGQLPNSAKQVLLDIAQKLQIQVCLLSKRKNVETSVQKIEAYDTEVIGPVTDELALKVLLSDHEDTDLIAKTTDKPQPSMSKMPKALYLKTTATQFLQVNEKVNQNMLALARAWIDSAFEQTKGLASTNGTRSPRAAPILYDFFCGAGNFSLALADLCEYVYGYEGVIEMVNMAANNAGFNGVNNCEFRHVDLSNQEQINNIEISSNAIAVLDPSREGALNLTQVLAKKQFAMIIYVSCNPNSFARDIKQLSPRYEVQQICALDMFPYTKHIEVMAKLLPR